MFKQTVSDQVEGRPPIKSRAGFMKINALRIVISHPSHRLSGLDASTDASPEPQIIGFQIVFCLNML